MPELPEVETIARGLARELVGGVIDSVTVRHPCAVEGDPAGFAAALKGSRVTGVSRRGKVLLVNFGAELVMAVHLRMTGRLVVEPQGAEPGKHTHLVLDLADGRRLFYSDIRKFGSCRAGAPAGLNQWPFFRTLGPEPLEISAREFAGLFRGRKARIKAMLLDQKVIAGIGNIYADEALFRAGIRPDARAADISDKRLERLHASLVEVLNEAIAANGSSFSDYVDSGGNAGAFQNYFRVYGRAGEPCRICGTALSKCKVAGRSTTFCERCQR
jgi:formamidopyrimidine-DNA glycosylase